MTAQCTDKTRYRMAGRHEPCSCVGGTRWSLEMRSGSNSQTPALNAYSVTSIRGPRITRNVASIPPYPESHSLEEWRGVSFMVSRALYMSVIQLPLPQSSFILANINASNHRNYYKDTSQWHSSQSTRLGRGWLQPICRNDRFWWLSTRWLACPSSSSVCFNHRSASVRCKVVSINHV